LATNESHSVKEFVDEACKVAGVSTKKIQSTKANFRPFDVPDLRGDYSKAKKKFGWEPKTKFTKLVKIMVEDDIKKWERWQKGEFFPWDAFTSGEDTEILTKAKK
jgi:GDPmannose 4,6-dehydratase